MMAVYFGLVVMTLVGSFASLFLKKASEANGFKGLLTNVNLYIGGFLYLLSSFLNIWALRSLEYSTVLPLTSLTYVWTMIISYFLLKEKITIKRVIGIVLILSGAVLVSV